MRSHDVNCRLQTENFVEDECGLGIEDSTFMIALTVIILIVAVSVSATALMQFIKDNEYQAAANAAANIYKRARLLSLTFDGATDVFGVSVPEGFSIVVDGGIYAARGNQSMSDEMTIQGVGIEGDEIPAGEHIMTLTYYSGYDPKVIVEY